jgi:hypothetical protein
VQRRHSTRAVRASVRRRHGGHLPRLRRSCSRCVGRVLVASAAPSLRRSTLVAPLTVSSVCHVSPVCLPRSVCVPRPPVGLRRPRVSVLPLARVSPSSTSLLATCERSTVGVSSGAASLEPAVRAGRYALGCGWDTSPAAYQSHRTNYQ